MEPEWISVLVSIIGPVLGVWPYWSGRDDPTMRKAAQAIDMRNKCMRIAADLEMLGEDADARRYREAGNRTLAKVLSRVEVDENFKGRRQLLLATCILGMYGACLVVLAGLLRVGKDSWIVAVALLLILLATFLFAIRMFGDKKYLARIESHAKDRAVWQNNPEFETTGKAMGAYASQKQTWWQGVLERRQA